MDIKRMSLSDRIIILRYVKSNWYESKKNGWNDDKVVSIELSIMKDIKTLSNFNPLDND